MVVVMGNGVRKCGRRKQREQEVFVMGSKKAVVVAGFEISRGIFSQALMSLGRYASVFQCASLKEATRDACGYDVVIVDWIVEEGPLAAEMVRALCGVLNPDATLIICLDPNMESRELRLSLMTAGADGIISRAGVNAETLSKLLP